MLCYPSIPIEKRSIPTVAERPRELPPSFLWVQGDPTKESELDKVRLTHAEAVIISGARDMSPQSADARTILITFTIRSYLKAKFKEVRKRRSPVYVVAEVLDSENVDHAAAAGADEVIDDGYALIVPDDLPPGRYPLHIGFYDPQSGARLPVQVGEEIQEQGAYFVGTLLVE